jgi:hypothetical protein
MPLRDVLQRSAAAFRSVTGCHAVAPRLAVSRRAPFCRRVKECPAVSSRYARFSRVRGVVLPSRAAP